MTDMKPLRSFTGESAVWEEWDRGEYRLKGDGDLFATLALGPDLEATATALEGQWLFTTAGPGPITYATIAALPSGAEIGTCRVLHKHYRKNGVLRLGSGYEFNFMLDDSLMTEFTWRSADGRDVLTLDRGINRATVRLLLASDRYRELSLLACFGWYLAKTWWT